jgi:hypothetical protein
MKKKLLVVVLVLVLFTLVVAAKTISVVNLPLEGVGHTCENAKDGIGVCWFEGSSSPSFPCLCREGQPYPLSKDEASAHELKFYGGEFCPCDQEEPADACVWTEDHKAWMKWYPCYQVEDGSLWQSVGTCGVWGGAIPCSYKPPAKNVPWCPDPMQEVENQWGGRGCAPPN